MTNNQISSTKYGERKIDEKNPDPMTLSFVKICEGYMKNNVAELTLSASARRRYNAQFNRIKVYFDYTVNEIGLQYFYDIVKSLDVSEAEKKRFVNFCKKALDFVSLYYLIAMPDFTVLAFSELVK